MKVTLDIFSGRENPTWDLSKKDTKKLVDIVAQKALPSVDAVESILGFRGYVISADSDDVPVGLGLPSDFRIGGTLFDQTVVPQGLALAVMTPKESDQAALWLLSTAGKAVEDEVLAYVEKTIKTRVATALEKPGRQRAPKVEKKTRIAAGCTIANTPYNPAFWNTPQTQPHNNCYNYAMNYRSNTFAQPGRISGHPNNVMQCANVAAAANWDGCRAVCSGSNKNVALVIWPNRDYHWYRFHSNGFWGHKPGSTAARNTDNRGRVIGGALNPQNCDRGNYTIFCGYRFSPTGMRVS